MSRAVNINAVPQAVTDICTQYNYAISVIEPLQSGGTRVVLLNGNDAANLRRRMASQLIEGPVVRSGLYARASSRLGF